MTAWPPRPEALSMAVCVGLRNSAASVQRCVSVPIQRLVFDIPVFHPLVDPTSGELDVKRAFAKWRLVKKRLL